MDKCQQYDVTEYWIFNHRNEVSSSFFFFPSRSRARDVKGVKQDSIGKTPRGERAHTQLFSPRGSPSVRSRFSVMFRDLFGALMFISVDVCFGNSLTAGHKGSAWTHRSRNSSVFVLRSQINCVFVWDRTSARERTENCSASLAALRFIRSQNHAKARTTELLRVPPFKIN